MSDEVTPVSVLMGEIRRFAEVRGWEPYHSPKNLVMALASEVGELCDLFRWLTPEESREIVRDPARRRAVADEIADVANIVLLLSMHAGIDLTTAIREKMVDNAKKYPAPGGAEMGLPS